MNRLAPIFIALLLGATACSGDSTTGGQDNNGWTLGDDAGNNASDGGTNNTSPNNANNANNSTNGAPNNTPTNNTPTNNSSTNNSTTPPTNNQTGSNNTNNNTMGNGTGVEGDPCMVNSACSANLTCCQGFDGNATCQPMCLGGGLCGGNDAECAGDEVCCDLSGINQPDSCVTENWCQNNNNGNPGTPCNTNSDCADPEVCCLGFDGSGECTTECLSGGACNDDTECRNGQLCCDITIAKVCFDQCSF